MPGDVFCFCAGNMREYEQKRESIALSYFFPFALSSSVHIIPNNPKTTIPNTASHPFDGMIVPRIAATMNHMRPSFMMYPPRIVGAIRCS